MTLYIHTPAMSIHGFTISQKSTCLVCDMEVRCGFCHNNQLILPVVIDTQCGKVLRLKSPMTQICQCSNGIVHIGVTVTLKGPGWNLPTVSVTSQPVSYSHKPNKPSCTLKGTVGDRL